MHESYTLPFIPAPCSPYLDLEELFYFCMCRWYTYAARVGPCIVQRKASDLLELRVTSNSEPPEGSSENQTHFLWKVIKCSEQVNHLSGPNFFLKLFFHLHLRRKSAAAITTLLLGSWRDKYESLSDHISLYIQDSTGLNLLFCPLLCLNSALIWMTIQAYDHCTYLTMMRDAD